MKKEKFTTKQYVSPCVPPPGFLKAAFYYVKILLKIINYRFYVTMEADVTALVFSCILMKISRVTEYIR